MNRETSSCSVSTNGLTLITYKTPLIINEVDGTRTFLRSRDLFKKIDPDFFNFRIDRRGPVTDETPVWVHGIARDTTYLKMFTPPFGDVGKFALTQHQIIDFVERYREWFQAWLLYFLLKVENRLFVVFVNKYDGGLEASVSQFEPGTILHPWDHHGAVLPE